jgi:tetratricopeptide (TPR) repeat protein
MRDLDACRAWKRRLDRICGAGVFGAALLIYLLTLSPGVFPGVSAALMAAYTGLEPLVAPAHPLWGAIVGRLGSLGAGGMALRLNLFSALCGALAAGLFHLLVSRLVHTAIDPADDTAENAVRASVLAGLVAAAALAFSVPFWMASTRLHHQSFDLLLLLLVTHLFLAYARTRREWLGLLFALCYGIGIVESPVFIPFAPLFILYAFVIWHRHDDIRLRRILLMGLLAVAGLGLFLLAARHFCATADITLRGYSGYWNVVLTMVRDHLRTLRHALPRVGWLLIVMLIVVPWLAAQLIAPRALNEHREWGIYTLHLAMTGIVVAILGNAPLSPWRLLRGRGGLPVTLYALTAMTAGYLAAYWYLLMANRKLMKVRDVKQFRVRAGVWLGYAMTWLLLVVTAAAALVNGFEAGGRRGAFADICARKLLDCLEGRRWLVSDGLLDSHLTIEAARRGRPLTLLALQKNDSAIYIRQIRKLIESDPEFAGLDRVRLGNSADLGVMTFVQDWMAMASNSVAARLAVMSAPDLLIGAGWTVAPNFFCFVGEPDREALRDVPFLEVYEPFWDEMERVVPRRGGRHDPVAAHRAALRRQIGFVANNLGVLLEDLERPEEAFRVYRRVRAIDPDNISALLNMAEMLNRDPDFMPQEKERVEQELRVFVENLEGRRLPLWSLSRHFGYVRSPLLFAQLGWTWALSGQPGMAMAGMRRAEAIAPTPASRLRVREAMAEMLMQQSEDERGEAVYEEILRSDPLNQRALVWMARIAARRGTLDKAREWLDKAQNAGVDRTTLALERAALFLAANEPEQARVALTEVTELQPRNLQAWSMLGVALMQMREFDEVERRVLPKMESIAGTPDNYLVQITRGQLAYHKGRDSYPAARDAFTRAAMLRPGMPMLLEWILRLDFLLGDKAAAEEHARQLLRQNRDHGFANYIMGSLMLERGRHAEAEDYLRRSVGASRSAAALNDLAELLRQSGNLEEAERRAREAIELAPNLYFAWDTLGGVLTDTRRWNEAEAAYAKALEIFADDLRIHLNLAKLLKAKGNLVKARETVARILPRKSELPPAEQEELARLARELAPR